MVIQTRSGSEYGVMFVPMPVDNGEILVMHAFRTGVDGNDWNAKCVAVFPDRLDHFLDSKKFEERDGKLVGLNKDGNVTCQFFTNMVKVGMILANTKGFKSTTITKIM